MQSRPLSREEVAHLEIGHTEIRRGAAVALVITFGALVTLTPLVQMVQGWRAAREQPNGEWRGLWSLGRHLHGAVEAWVNEPGGWWDRVLAANHAARVGLRQYEEEVEDTSWLQAMVQPRAQWVFSRVLGAGNEQTHIGRTGWLFFDRELNYVTRRGFLHPREQARRRAEGDRWTPAPQPDPVTAIVEFRNQLAAHGIRLVVLPVPVKVGVRPDRFSRRSVREWPLRNADWTQFIERLESAGVDVFDPVPTFQRVRKQCGSDLYLRTDTHWRPEVVEAVAEDLARHIRAYAPIAPTASTGVWTVVERTVTNFGDLAVLLNTAEWTGWPPAETFTIRSVVSVDGQPWRPDRSAKVLVLGDSFCNIYSLASMGWGSGAGLAEHLSRQLGCPVDRIVRNDAGAYATRQELLDQVAGNPNRLASTRVIVWEFSERELVFGDWKRIPWPTGHSADPP
jgi:alginate O-acetyltransferase complex protein AlgJ